MTLGAIVEAPPTHGFAAVRAALLAENVNVGELSVVSETLNIGLSDQANIFVKLSRNGVNERLAREVQNVAMVMAAGTVRTAKPITGPLTLDVDGAQTTATVWELLTTVRAPEPTDVPQIVEETMRVQSLGERHLPFDRFSLKPHVDRVWFRLAGSTHPQAQRTARHIAELLPALHETIKGDRRAWLPSHADPHPGNFLIDTVNGDLIHLDWEDAFICPREWALAQLVYPATSVERLPWLQPKMADSTALETWNQIRPLLEPAVNRHLIEQFIDFRALSATSFLVHIDADPNMIETRLSWIEDPARFERTWSAD